MSDVPDADLHEQQQPVKPVDEPIPLSFEPEIPDADAVEQAQPAPLDDEDHR